MRLRRHDPNPRLRDLVRGYWELEDLHLAWPEQNFDVPERSVRLMFLASEIRMGPSADTMHLLPPVSLTPFVLHPQRTVGQGKLRALMVDLYPWAARQLLGWRADHPPDALNLTLSASPWGRDVIALLHLRDWDAARHALETHLLTLAHLHDDPGPAVQAAHRIYHAAGVVRVADLAETLNLSPRTLERQFAQQVGVSAKTLARVVRFDEANTRIRLDPTLPMAELTFQLGFFDQAHLIREFKALSSLTPRAFAALAARRQHHLDLDLLNAGHSQYVELESRLTFAPERH